MSIITLDMETFYDKDYSLSKMTTESYIRDPRFETIGFSIKVESGMSVWFSGDYDTLKRKLDQFELHKHIVIAHNAAFDCAILNWRFGIKPRFIIDTMSMARPEHGLTTGLSLAKLAAHYELGVKGTEVVAALGMRRGDFSHQQLYEYGQYCCNDVDLTYDAFRRLAVGFPRQELEIIDMMIRMFTEPVLTLDGDVLQSHLDAVIANKERLMATIEVGTADIMSNDKFAAALESYGVVPPTKISPKTGKLAYAFAKTDGDFRDLLEHEDERVQALVAARLGLKSTLEETRTQAFLGIRERGTLPIMLNYYGAHTGRASGGDKVNLQNLPRGGALRNAITAPDGHMLVACDSSQIEARMVGWAAGQDDLTAAFAAGEDIYSLFASDVYGRKIVKGVDNQERHVGKTAILGLGYGMSAAKFKISLKNGKPSVDLPDDECQGIVALYRRKYAKIKAFWKDCHNAMLGMYEGRRVELIDGLVYTDGNTIVLPNGMRLRYTDLNTENGKDFVYFQRKKPVHVYGAKITENLIQALARIVVFDQMRAISKRYKVVLTVHDEVVICVPENEVEVAMAFMTEQMSIAPDWAAGLPITCEAGFGKTYGDCK